MDFRAALADVQRCSLRGYLVDGLGRIGSEKMVAAVQRVFSTPLAAPAMAEKLCVLRPDGQFTPVTVESFLCEEEVREASLRLH